MVNNLVVNTGLGRHLKVRCGMLVQSMQHEGDGKPVPGRSGVEMGTNVCNEGTTTLRKPGQATSNKCRTPSSTLDGKKLAMLVARRLDI